MHHEKIIVLRSYDAAFRLAGAAGKRRSCRPNVFHLLELYADDNAYRAHIDGPYFQEYNKAVQTMVTDKVLIVNKPQAVTLSGKNLK